VDQQAMDAATELFGPERLEMAVRRWSARPVKEIIQGIRQEVTEFTRKEAQDDDITILVCRIVE
jgi:serine phosphatase RsbU (regulator of sigma subunit)